MLLSRRALRLFSSHKTPGASSAAAPLSKVSDTDVLQALRGGKLSVDKLEQEVGDLQRAISLRRAYYEGIAGKSFEGVPFKNYDWETVHGQCCERVVGYVPIPVGVIGPFLIDGKEYLVPMATTEGALVASTNRGAKAISVSGGSTTMISKSGMTRAPVVRFRDLASMGQFKSWIVTEEAQAVIQREFSKTTRFGKLLEIKTAYAHRSAYLRFVCDTGDAMGMNMVSKGVQAVVDHLLSLFAGMELVSISGNYCTDKKPAAVNWIEGRGKSLIAETRIHRKVAEDVLKISPERIVDVNLQKNYVGSAMAGSIGGFNSHAANMVAAVYLACGQDPAQVVESAQCLTYMEVSGDYLHASVTMPCIEVGTVGGGTSLGTQATLLRLLGCQGPHPTTPGRNSDLLARVVASTVLAGELSLTAALGSGSLVSAHMNLNRKKVSETPFQTKNN